MQPVLYGSRMLVERAPLKTSRGAPPSPGTTAGVLLSEDQKGFGEGLHRGAQGAVGAHVVLVEGIAAWGRLHHR